MNFLAHLYLSGKNEDIIFGNFIADAVKGKAIENYNSTIIEGIRLHRKIDQFTDNHIVVKRSKTRLLPTYHKFSGVVVDMYYDHFLAANWPQYSNEGLATFVDKAYKLLKRKFFLLPSRYKKILPFMIGNNWLVNYANFDRLQNNFENMARRTSFESGMENAVVDLKKDYDEYKQEFEEFFLELIDFANNNNKFLG